VPPFEKPRVEYAYEVDAQIRALRRHKERRKIPAKAPDRLLLATWNIANLGDPGQQRRDDDHRLIAELLGWFDLVAVQEVHDDSSALRAVHRHLPPEYRLIFSDAGGNEERAAFVYDSAKVTLLEKVGEIAIPPAAVRHIRLPGITQGFGGFDRNPYLAGFRVGALDFLLVNVHLYFGSDKGATSKRDMNRRALEAYAVARWADLRRTSPFAYSRNIIALGDFNLPKIDPADPIYAALTRRGLRLPEHSTKVGSNLAGDRYYDQLAFFPPGETERALVESAAVFDFDGAVFSTLWQRTHEKEPRLFFDFLRYYLSDHRILWTELRP